MSTQSASREQKLIAEQAAQWVCDLRAAGAETQAEFLAWLKRSPRHVQEYLFAATLWRETHQMAAASDLDMDRVIAEAKADETGANVVPLSEARRSALPGNKPRRRGFRLAAAVAVFGVMGVLAWMAIGNSGNAATYTTAVGEQRAIRLTDGSLLYLNTRSRIQVRFSDHARTLRLIEGEALFSVQSDPARPFRVEAGDTVVQALGTQFNVYRRREGTVISVLDGMVSVNHSVTLPAGAAVNVAPDGRIARQTTPPAASPAAWRERRLVFEGEPLAVVAEEFNRYNPRQIRVDSEAARRRLLSGTFDTDDPGSLILFLRKLEGLTLEERDDEIVVR